MAIRKLKSTQRKQFKTCFWCSGPAVYRNRYFHRLSCDRHLHLLEQDDAVMVESDIPSEAEWKLGI